METIKNVYNACAEFCNRVVQWRSACSIPYIFAVNTAFWAIAYYGNTDQQMKSLAALALIIFCNDVLFSPTHNRSILMQIVLWPIRDLFKTLAVILCGAGIHQLGEGNKEEAFWCSYVAIIFILISPVYRYNEINQKIVNSWFAIGSFIKSVLTYCIVRPILYLWEGFKYVFLLRWLPGLNEWLRSSRNSLYEKLDQLILKRIKAFGSKCAEIFRYWFYFRWVADLKSLLYAHIGEPLLQKLRIVRDHFVYVFGGYWFYPLMRHCGKVTWSLTCYLGNIANDCAVAIGNSVLYPLVLVAYDKTKEVVIVVYDAFGRPVVNVLYQKYKIVEDAAFIYVIGPTVKTLLDIIPEKNPFYSEEDEKELDQFIPGPVGDANEVAEEEFVTLQLSHLGETISDELPQELQIHDEDFDDLDDDRFLTQRLQRDFSGTDSSEDEFSFVSQRRHK